jgi:hypothetical protein
LTAGYIKREISIVAEQENDHWVCRCVPARMGWHPGDWVLVGPKIREGPPQRVWQPAIYNFEVTAAGIEDLLPLDEDDKLIRETVARKWPNGIKGVGAKAIVNWVNDETGKTYTRYKIERAIGRRK